MADSRSTILQPLTTTSASSGRRGPRTRIEFLKTKVPKAGAKKKHYSDWLIPISSNIRGANKSDFFLEGVYSALKKVLLCVLDDPDHIFQIFNKKPGTPGGDLTMDDFDTFKQVIKVGPLEIGTKPRGSRIHLHALDMWTHTTYLRLDANVFRKIAAHCLSELKRTSSASDPVHQIKGLYINIKWVPSAKPYLNYIHKAGARIYNPRSTLTLEEVRFWETYNPAQQGRDVQDVVDALQRVSLI